MFITLLIFGAVLGSLFGTVLMAIRESRRRARWVRECKEYNRRIREVEMPKLLKELESKGFRPIGDGLWLAPDGWVAFSGSALNTIPQSNSMHQKAQP